MSRKSVTIHIRNIPDKTYERLLKYREALNCKSWKDFFRTVCLLLTKHETQLCEDYE